MCQHGRVTNQTPAGWYADDEGDLRYWDGAQWTDGAQPPPGAPGASGASGASGGVGRDGGAFGKLKKAAAGRQAAKGDRGRTHADSAREAGVLVTSGIFGTSTVEIYSGGFVRVASGEKPNLFGNSQPGRTMRPGQPVPIKKSTPFETLRSIKFTPAASDTTSRTATSSENAMGPAVAKLMKGGKAALKGSVPGLAATGIAHIASTESRTSYLTIATDREIHQLTNQGHNGYVRTTHKGHVAIGRALEDAGNTVLGVNPDRTSGDPTDPSPVAPPPVPEATALNHPGGPASMGDRIRELAALHAEGILSDEEFAGAKAKLLSGL